MKYVLSPRTGQTVMILIDWFGCVCIFPPQVFFYIARLIVQIVNPFVIRDCILFVFDSGRCAYVHVILQ